MGEVSREETMDDGWVWGSGNHPRREGAMEQGERRWREREAGRELGSAS